MSKIKTTRLLVLGTVAVAAVVFFASQVSALEKAGVRASEIVEQISLGQGEYLSPVYDTDFEFNLAGLAWQDDDLQEAKIRYADEQNWSQWYDLDVADSVMVDGWHYLVEPLIAENGEKIQYSVKTENHLEQIKLIYLGADDGQSGDDFNIFKWLFSTAVASEELDIISREEWEADETWRYEDEEEIWPTEYQWPEKFVIHHTAGSDGGDDPAGTVRGIYYWHAVVLGWGDIGYNYLIDQDGNIYEGRDGGDGAIGAHVYRDAACAEQRFGGEEYEHNFNPGTIGISVLGDYQNDLTLNAKVKTALSNLIAYKGNDFEIIPDGDSYFFDDTYDNVVGHKDLDCTVCPGDSLYSQLGAIRAAARTKYEDLGGVTKPVIKATFLGMSEQPVEVMTGMEKEVWVDFRNDGNVTWRNYTEETLTVLAKSNDSSFYVAAWDSPTQVAVLDTANVAPGATGRFVFTIKGPTDSLEVTEEFALRFGDQLLSNTTFSITAQVTGFKYAATLEDQSILPATFIRSSQNVTIQFQNRGTEIWQQGDIKLKIYDLGDRVSRYYDPSWPDQYGQIDFTESAVKPGGLATFTFKFLSPRDPGTYLNIYRLDGTDELVYQEDYSVTRVDSIYQAELVGHTIPPAILNVWRPTVTFTFKNTGIANWDRSFGLQILDLGGAISRFYDPSWGDVRIAGHLNEASVAPGENGTFTIRLRPPQSAGLYLNSFRIFYRGQPVAGGGFSLITRVD